MRVPTSTTWSARYRKSSATFLNCGRTVPLRPDRLNDLPKFSAWPARLLGIEHWSRPPRSVDENQREYERERWGSLLRRAEELGAEARLDVIDRIAQEFPERVLCADGDTLEEVSGADAHARYRDVVAEILSRYVPAPALVELGCGYGSVIVDMGRRPQFRGIPLYGADLTTSGPRVMEIVGAAEGVGVAAGTCDFTATPITSLDVPPGALVYTAFAAACVPTLTDGFVESLATLRPGVVVHIEPCHEHCSSETLLGLLRRRYIEMNDYNTNLVTLLHGFRDSGRIRIVEERPPVFGPNPLLSASVLAWKPAGERDGASTFSGGR